MEMNEYTIPLAFSFVLSISMRFAGLRLEDVFALFEGLDALPDVLLSVVLVELCEFIVDVARTT